MINCIAYKRLSIKGNYCCNKNYKYLGRSYDEKGLFYRFYEVGTKEKSRGANDENKLYFKNNALSGKTTYGSNRNYVVTQIRKNKTYKESE